MNVSRATIMALLLASPAAALPWNADDLPPPLRERVEVVESPRAPVVHASTTSGLMPWPVRDLPGVYWGRPRNPRRGP
jgi:hypothetical protein